MEKINDEILDQVVGGTAAEIKIFKTADNKWVCTSGREYDSVPNRKFLGGQFIKTKKGTWVRTLWNIFDTEEEAKKFDPAGQGLLVTQPKSPDGPTTLEIPITINIKEK